MIYVFYFFAAILVFIGFQSLRGGLNYFNFFKQELSKPKSDYTPFCSIIAPCRGLDQDFHENISALFRQDFPLYEIIFVVDDASDAAVAAIKTVIEAEEKSAKIIIAGRADGESQKVHNLRQAILEVSTESKAFVFVDSDARPAENWLRNLVAPLANETVGCATGYRWFVQKNGGLATALRSVWNASIASALGANTKGNFCWGGSLAIRRETFEKNNLREKWCGTLSDDFVVTRAMKEANLPIRFVPGCLIATVEDCTFRDFLEFSTRQMKITRVYAEHFWKASLIGSFLFSAGVGTGIVLLFFLSDVHFWLTIIILLTIFLLGAAKSYLRLRAVKMVLTKYEKQLNRQFLPHLTLWIVTPLIYFHNCVQALFSRKIVWRGIEYKLKSATETEVLTTNNS